MRWSVAVVVAVVAGRTARADDPRDLFGLGQRDASPPKPEPSCDQPQTFGCATVADPLDDVAPLGLTTFLTAPYLRRLPVANTTHDVLASYALGAGRDETGPTFGGATGLENRWTIEGAPSDGIRTGAADTRVPLSFLAGMTMRAVTTRSPPACGPDGPQRRGDASSRTARTSCAA